MRKPIVILCVLAVVAVLCVPARPGAAATEGKGPKTVGDFISDCAVPTRGAPADAYKFFWYCAGVTDGVVGALMNLKAWGYTKGPCLPSKFTHGQIMQAFQDWARANPKFRSRPGADGFLLAMLETWPCR